MKLGSTIEWILNDKTSFTLEELFLDSQLLKKVVKVHQLNVPDSVFQDFVVSTDTFNFCNSYDPVRYAVNAARELRVTLKYEKMQEKVFIFDFLDFYENKFNLQDYLMVYPLLKDKLPAAYIATVFFSKATLLNVLGHYIKTIDCEEYYYDEFMKAKPERTAQENRMKVGWKCKEYMRNREKQ